MTDPPGSDRIQQDIPTSSACASSSVVSGVPPSAPPVSPAGSVVSGES